MKAQPCILIGNTSYGYCFNPQEFPSRNKAISYGKKMINDGYWFAYRIIKKGVNDKT